MLARKYLLGYTSFQVERKHDRKKEKAMTAKKPTKANYNKFANHKGFAWANTTNEVLISLSNSVITEAKSREEFEPWYQTEAAVSYGLKKGMVIAKPSQKNSSYHELFLTDKGLADNVKRQQNTCLFTGRKI